MPDGNGNTSAETETKPCWALSQILMSLLRGSPSIGPTAWLHERTPEAKTITVPENKFAGHQRKLPYVLTGKMHVLASARAVACCTRLEKDTVQNNPPTTPMRGENRKCRVPRGGKRSPDSDYERHLLQKSGFGVHFGLQKCDFKSNSGGGAPRRGDQRALGSGQAATNVRQEHYREPPIAGAVGGAFTHNPNR
jgi:hypothetical protein